MTMPRQKQAKLCCWTKCQCIMLDVLNYGDPGDSRLGYLLKGPSDYWFAPGTRSHLHVPETTRSGKVLIAHFLMTHTEPNLWKPQGGEVGQEKHTFI